MSTSTLFTLYEEKNEGLFFFLSRDVNVNMFLSLKRAKCTVYDRLRVFVLGAFWKGGVDLHGAAWELLEL